MAKKWEDLMKETDEKRRLADLKQEKRDRIIHWLVGFLIVFCLIWASVTLHKVELSIKKMDQEGGLKSVVDRVWYGQQGKEAK
jgi:hypothetical protein